MNELNGDKGIPEKDSPEDLLLGHKVNLMETKLGQVETELKHTAKMSNLEKAIGDMKEGIALAIGKMEKTGAEAKGEMKVEIATAIGEMKTSVAETKWGIIKWILGGITTLIGLGLISYRLFFFNPPT